MKVVMLLAAILGLQVPYAYAQEQTVEVTLPVLCRNFSQAPCDQVAKIGLTIALDEQLIECLKREAEHPGDCLPQVLTEFDWPADALIVGIPEKMGAMHFLAVEPISARDFLTVGSEYRPATGAMGGLFIPEHCLVGKWDPEHLPPECGGVAEALSKRGFALTQSD